MAINIIAQLEQEESARLLAARAIPEFRPGDTLRDRRGKSARIAERSGGPKASASTEA